MGAGFRYFSFALLFGSTAAACGQGASAGQTRVTLDTLSSIVRVTDPQISPDGRKIVVVVARQNLKEDRADSELVLVDVESRQQTVLTQGKVHVGFPRWSPSGDRLAYLANDDQKHLEVFVLPMAGGDSVQVTHNEGGVSQLAWQPDGRALAYVATDDEPKHDKNDDAFEVTENDYLVTGSSPSAHLWIAPADGTGTPRRLTSGAWSLPVSFPPGAPASPINFSPDGKQIFYVRAESPLSGDAERTTLEVLEVATGQSHPLTTRTRLEQYPQVSPDGKQVAFWYPREGKPWNENAISLIPYDEASMAPVAAAQERVITGGIDRNLVRAIWTADSQNLLVGGNDGVTTSLWLQPVAGGAAKKLAMGDVTVSTAFWIDATFGPKGELAVVGTGPHRAAELYLKSSPDAAPVRLTSFNEADDNLQLGRVETLHWATTDPKGKPDGMEADGVLTYPPDYSAGRKYPLVLYIHGGPTSCSKAAFSAVPQLLAAQGWLVFEPNYRGSDNLGNRFQAAIWNDAGAGPGRDVMAGVSLLKARGMVDESRVAVSGWSYGGFMTTWLLGNYPGWRAAVDGAAVTDWVDMYNLGDGVTTIGDNFGGSPNDETRLKAYFAQSPITYARNIKAPTLILSDTGDARVPITQSYRLYRILKENGTPVRFFAYPVPGHFPGDPVRARDVFRRWVDWLTANLNGAPPPASTAPASTAR